jgi:hypothetical protein
MFVAVTVTIVGILTVATITQLFGYRTGGTITIPVVAVYTLKNFYMLPIFLFSTVVAYVVLYAAKHRTLVYGRDELLIAMGVGSAVPLALLLGLSSSLPESLRSVVFIGSILPGLAAYNYHQVKPQYRKWDVLTTGVVLCGLVALGWLLVSPELATSIGSLTPPVLYSATADVALQKAAVVPSDLEPTILERPVAVVLFLFGVAISERIRSRYGVRTGLVAMALLAIYALANAWLVVLYLLVLAAAYTALKTVHYVTLLYGRVLIAAATVGALLIVVPLTLALPTARGLSAFFVAIIAGVNAYSWHVTSPTHRTSFVPLQVGAFLFLLAITQLFALVRPDVVPSVYGVPVLVVMVVVSLACVAFVEYRTVDLPDQDSIFEASILSGGGES